MPKSKHDIDSDLPLDALILQCEKDRYKMGYAALRWAKEIKQKENLPDPVPSLVPRSLRELLTGKVAIKEVEKLPMMVKVVVTAQPAAPVVPTPTITIKADAEDEVKEKKED